METTRISSNGYYTDSDAALALAFVGVAVVFILTAAAILLWREWKRESRVEAGHNRLVSFHNEVYAGAGEPYTSEFTA